MWSEADRETYKDDGRRYPSDLTDDEWALLAPLVLGYDPLTADPREIVNACLYLEKTGWRGAICRPTSALARRCARGMTASERTDCGRRWRLC